MKIMKWGMFIVLVLLFGCISQPVEAEKETLENKTFIDFEEKETEKPEPNVSADIQIEIPDVNTTINITENVTGNITAKNETEEKNETLLFFGESKYSLRLVDVTDRSPGEEACAAVEFLYSNGTLIEQGRICPGEDHYWTSPDGHRFRIVVTEVVAGYAKEAVWAKVLIFG